MKLKVIILSLAFPLLISCGSNNVDEKTSSELVENKTTVEENGVQSKGIVGEWEQQFTCFDKNANYTLEEEEKIPSNVTLGFNWFRFNTDGTSLRVKELKFKSNYEVVEKDGKRKLLIHSGDNINYTISELTNKELILGKDGAFMVFKRIK